MDFKLILDAKAVMAETPVWDSRIGKLYWTDLSAGDIHRFDPETNKDKIWRTLQPIGGVCLCDNENYVLCAIESGLYILDLRTGMLDFLLCPEKRMGYKFNDTRIDPVGRIFTSSVSKYLGTPKYTPDMLGAFYMVDTNFSIKMLVGGITQYNGIVWNRSATKMFVVNTQDQTLIQFDYDLDKGPVSGPKTVLDLTSIGMPDGISIDSEDNLYICHWSKKISVWDKDLKLSNMLITPVENVCCGGFGGADMDTFFIGTASYGCCESNRKSNLGAGGIFCAGSSIRGVADNYYRIHI